MSGNAIPAVASIWSRTGLLTRLSVAVGLLILVGAGIEMTLMIRSTADTYRLQQENEAKEISRFLAPLVAEYAVIGDYATIQQILLKQVQDRLHIEHLNWTDLGGQVIQATDADIALESPAWFAQLAGIPALKKTTPVILGGQSYGDLDILFSPIPAQNALWRLLAGHLVEILLVVSLSFVAIIIIMRNNLVTVARLTQGADQFSRGDHSVRIPERGAPEVRGAARAFNNLAGQISSLVANLSEKQSALKHSETSLAEAQRIARLGNWEWDMVSNQVHWSDELYRILGYAPQQFIANYAAFVNAVHPEDRRSVMEMMDRVIQQHEPYSFEHRIMLPNGAVRSVHAQGEVTLDANNKPLRMVGALQDVTEQKLAQERLSYLAYFDPLTGLPNRVLLNERMQQAMAEASRVERLVAILYLDLDRFKYVNDTLGHEFGDALIKMVAERLTGLLRPGGDTVSHYGGDEFTIVLANVAHVDDVTRVAQKIVDSFARHFTVASRDLFITASIGITLYPFDDSSIENLLKNADAAMYHAKERGRNTFQFYTAEMNIRAARRFGIETALRHALERGELSLHYQPQVDLKTGSLYGMEALLRWHSAEFGSVSPVEFIPLAEESGLIQSIGEWVLRSACAQTRAWQKAGFADLRIAVNLSARQFRQENLVQLIRQTLIDTELEARFLDLEITESMLMHDMDRTVATLMELSALGSALSVDDFGTGYSSLSYLKRFPIDVLKIDRSFVNDITGDPDDAAIATAIIAMAHSLGIKVVAEGVETQTQMEFLQQQHCDAMQGYLFSKPLPVHEFSKLLENRYRARALPEYQAML